MAGTASWTRIGRAMALALAVAGGAAAQGTPRALPFSVGEEAVFRVSRPGLGRVGTGTLRVSGPEEVRGQRAVLLSFDIRGRVAIATVEDHTRSWLVPERMASLRYTKRERSPVGSRDQDVTIDPAARRWTEGDRQGPVATDAPLDELSFLFLLRTLPLETGATYDLNRHYDPRRNPVTLRVLRRSRVTVPAGTFDVVEVEMQVRDPERYGGRPGVIRIQMSDDARRLPVRIESSVPVLGRMVMSLESYTPGAR